MNAVSEFEIREMTPSQRKAVAKEYLLRLDRGGDFMALFDENAQVYFPKWGIAKGRVQIQKMFSDLFLILKAIEHPGEYQNISCDGDTVIIEGTTFGTTAKDIEWRAGLTHAGRFCDVFEVRDFRIQRLFIYLDPDYGGEDTARYPWLTKA